MTLTSQGNMATRPVSNMDKLIKLLHTIEIEVQDKSGKGAWTGARLWYRPLKTPQKREPRRKKKKAREVVAAGPHLQLPHPTHLLHSAIATLHPFATPT